jgi:cyanophycin synthetase
MTYENIPVIKKAVKAMGGKITPISPVRFAYEISYKNKKFSIISKFAIKSNLAVSPLWARYKDLTDYALKRQGIRTPKAILITEKYSPAQILRLAKRLSSPFVIKDAQGSESKGIFMNIKSLKQALRVIRKNIKKYKYLIIQEMTQGNEFRVLLLGQKILGVLRLIPPHVIGDGRSKTADLIRKKQRHAKEKTPFCAELEELLGDQGEKLISVPKKGKRVFLRKNSCLAEGGMSVECTKDISPRLAKICFRAAESVGLQLAGIDLICEDIHTGERDYQIIDINGKPDIWIHHHPTFGEPRNVTKEIIEYIVRKVL